MACKVKYSSYNPSPVSSLPKEPCETAVVPTNLQRIGDLVAYHNTTRAKSLLARKTRMCQAIETKEREGNSMFFCLSISDIAPYLTEKKTGPTNPNERTKSMQLVGIQFDYVNVQLEEWFRETTEEQSFDPQECDTAFFLLDQYLFSVTRGAGQSFQTFEDSFKFLPLLLSPVFEKRLTKDWHFHLQLIAGFLDITAALASYNSGNELNTESSQKHFQSLLNFLMKVPCDHLSLEAKASYHSYKAQILKHLKCSEDEQFKEIKLAAETGQSDAQLSLGLTFCGLFFDTDKYTNLEKGLDSLSQLKELKEETIEDDLATLRAEDHIFQIHKKNIIPTEKNAQGCGKNVIWLALCRRFGIGCIKNLEREEKLLNYLKSFHKKYHLLYTSIIALLDKQLSKLTLLPGENGSATKKWFAGKRLELQHKPGDALKAYKNGATRNPLIIGMAPVRLACSIGHWKQALESLLLYHQALIDNKQVDEAESLEEEIQQLTTMLENDPAPSPTQDSGLESLLFYHQALIDNKQVDEAESLEEKIQQLTTMLENDPAPSPTQDSGKPKKKRNCKSKGSTTSTEKLTAVEEPKATLSTLHTIKEEPETLSKESTSKSILTPHASEVERRAFNRALSRINQLIRTRKYSTALSELNQMVEAPTVIHRAKAQQVKAWAKRCQAMDYLEVRRIAGEQKTQQSSERTRLRHEAEQVTLSALGELIEYKSSELEQMTSNPTLIAKTRTFSPEVSWAVGSLCSTVGHIYSDTVREHPQMKYLNELSKGFYDCANTANPCRLLIKSQRALLPRDQAAARY